MCGIAGEVNFQGKASSHYVNSMLECLAPRGPDGWGLTAQGNTCFGHQRLKVIDLTAAGAQPMHDARLGLTIVFNGCIYNYKALRQELEQLGHQFFSTSDTEVILKAYAQWQEQCMSRFNGMFAFAIWHRDSNSTFFARDRLGIKPLYYHHNQTGFWFSSTLPSLLKCPEVPAKLSPLGVHQYMSFRAIVGADTLFSNVHKLLPGHWLKVSADGEISQGCYWQLNSKVDDSDKRSEQDWQEALKASLFSSAKRRLEADVPVGVLLSGGVDSSLLVGMLSELGQKKLHTFSIGFDNVAEEEGNEFKYSDIIAGHYDTEHNKIFARHGTLLEHLRPCIDAMSEPMVSHDVIGFYLLAQAVSQHVKVVQSGQGADEVFAGYHWYPPMTDVSEQDAAERYAQAYFSWDEQALSKVLAPEFCLSNESLKLVQHHFANCGARLPVDKALHLDTSVMLVDDPVKRVDNMTMAFGLEARVPFLDHELVELAFQIPHPLKLRDGGKYLLKQVARDIIPSAVIDRPKGYFPVPALRQMQGEYLELAKEVFSQPEARARKLFNMNYIDAMLAAPEHYTGKFGSKLWQATLLELWLQRHGIH
ncbi:MULTISPECIES: N-acetylglutaminylglutamine amidotransferase [unclassified Arsukibacterium]|uniref:N-acetylglutaminylglutamine amidotransferase n=1 Tax=unclassified Arsukibacterium TaxID=2635278 RepID=UPI000C98C279|nr:MULTISPECIES: N-acetylglutaminylglutamine amidotransferase [unclassified Arsukibacterium]MAA96521.1 N-acetylglutaminylglutamine amidotransferase [Rheinheimera sp.]HAW94222.1 N-acetylglutaminylglutamine amidotransferase [Candidatus Azambacteria bacterium]